MCYRLFTWSVMDKYPYPREFRLKILSLMLDNHWMAKYGFAIVQPEYFEQDDEEDVAKAIVDYRTRYRVSPKDPADLNALTTKDRHELVEQIYGSHDIRLASDIAIQWAKQQSVKLAILDSIDDIQRGELDKPLDKMRQALRVGDSLESPGLDPIADIDKWLYEMWKHKVPTGWYHIDQDMEGGLDAGEEGVILGPLNRGKTMGLISLGYQMASPVAGVNVVHFTHELRPDKVCKRYVARMLFRFPSQSDNLQQYAEEAVTAARSLLVGKIRVIGGAYKMTTQELEGHVDRLIEDGFIPGAIIDDYADLIVPPRKYTERRFELTAVFEWYRSLGDRYNCPMWTATQGNRGSLSKEIITAADIAEDIGKAQAADVMIALCQTSDEYTANQCRLYMAKVRDNKKNNLYSAKFYGDSQAIITTGIVDTRKIEKNV